MNKKLEIELFRYENLLFGKVLHMDESLRGAGILYTGSEIVILSRFSPMLECTDFFIRGEGEEYDNRVFSFAYCDEEEAIKVGQDIKNGIDCINGIGVREDSSSMHRVI